MNVAIVNSIRSHALNMVPMLMGFHALGAKITFYALEKSRHDLLQSAYALPQDIEWIIAPTGKPEHVDPALQNAIARSSDFDLMLIDTISENLIDFRHIRPRCPSILTVHDIDRLFKRWARLKKGQFRRVYYNHQIISNFTVLNAYSRNQANTLRRIPLVNKPVVQIAARIFDPASVQAIRDRLTIDDKVTFAIPGYVDEDRRDYKSVLDAFERFDSQMPNRARLVLLGPPVAERDHATIKRCESMARRGVEVVSHREFVSPAVFSNWLARTDMLIAPNHEFFPFPGFPEKYGVTKTSGVISDQAQWGLPVVLPAYIPPEEDYASCTLSYQDTDDLARVMERLVSDATLLATIKQNAVVAASQYTLDNVVAYLRDKVLPAALGR